MVLVQKEIKRVTIRPNGTEKQIRPVLITTAGIYHNPSLGLISLSSDGTNWITIADKNLGATQVYNDGDTLSEANCGKYYQWGNNYGFPFTGNVTTSSTQVNASIYGPGNYYNSSTLIMNNVDWDNSGNYNLWGGITGTVEAMQGPCSTGFHIPTNLEWGTLINTGISLGAWQSNDGTSLSAKLKIPLSGRLRASDNTIIYKGTGGSLWTSITEVGQYDISTYLLYFTPSVISYNSSTGRGTGNSIRPFANTPVQPDDSWEVLYLTQ